MGVPVVEASRLACCAAEVLGLSCRFRNLQAILTSDPKYRTFEPSASLVLRILSQLGAHIRNSQTKIWFGNFGWWRPDLVIAPEFTAQFCFASADGVRNDLRLHLKGSRWIRTTLVCVAKK